MTLELVAGNWANDIFVSFPHLCPWSATGRCAVCEWIRTKPSRKQR